MAQETAPHPEIALSLALAVVAASTTPLLLLDGELVVLAASASFGDAFDVFRGGVGGSLFAMGAGEWNVPQLRSLLDATVSGGDEIAAYEFDLKRDGRETRCLILNAHLLAYGDPGNVRVLLAVADDTDARAAAKLNEDLLREKSVLLQEIQHRVANSLQIIASVLLQSARKVQSEETRGHLHNAHSRVMSIAAVQQQLAASHIGEVALRPYLTKLCASLGASMISDHDALSIRVDTDDSHVSASVSVSLGLIVTELVINALKHAFDGIGNGHIVVEYHASGADWELKISDDGIGMPTGRAAKPGLGTSIVEALSRQLHARIVVAPGNPGTRVTIAHNLAAANDGRPEELAPAV